MVRRSLALFLFALSLRAQVVQLPHATLQELACAPEIIATPPHEHHHKGSTRDALHATAISEQAQVTAQAAAPVLGKNFFIATSRAFFPADAAGAVGPQHVVAVLNTGIFIFDRNGNRLNSTLTLAQFWSDPTIFSGLYYDPRILYDKFADRWFMVALYDNNLRNSTLVVGVSDGGDPAGGWSRYRISVGSDLADFTRLGMSADRFIVTANASHGSFFWLMQKADAYSTLKNVQNGFDSDYDYEPVTIVDNSTNVAYLIRNDFFGAASLFRFDSGTTFPTRIKEYSCPPWALLVNTEIGPQPASGFMDVGETSFQAAVGRDGTVWGVHTIVSTTKPVHSGIRWWRMPMSGAAADTGTIDDPAAHNFYAFPSIAVNRLGGALISYSLFSADRYPTAAYAYRDPSGTMSATGILKDGEAIPLTTRWGDFTTTVVDPLNDLDFWSVQPYANDQLWATWWGQITIPAAPARMRAVRH